MLKYCKPGRRVAASPSPARKDTGGHLPQKHVRRKTPSERTTEAWNSIPSSHLRISSVLFLGKDTKLNAIESNTIFQWFPSPNSHCGHFPKSQLPETECEGKTLGVVLPEKECTCLFISFSIKMIISNITI